MIESTHRRRTASAAIAAVAAFGLISAQAAPARAASSIKMPPKSAMMSHSKGVYVCTICREYYTPAQAASMKYKDSMGHHLMKMSTVPTGYMAGGKSAMKAKPGKNM